VILSAAFGLPSEIIFIKERGIGTASQRSSTPQIWALLVPSLVALLGQGNSWAPRRCGA